MSKGKGINLLGARFGRLLVISQGEARFQKNGWKIKTWNCRCDCGNTGTIRDQSLRIDGTKSCGCLQREAVKAMSTKHGRSHDKIFRVWASMIDRCEREKCADWPRYGGRGVKVCERWRNSFEAFVSDMGERPDGYFTIERSNNNGDYEPGNCHWATAKEQCRNKRNNRLLTFNGETLCLLDWGIRLGFRKGLIQDRLDRLGWPLERALTTPPRRW